MPTTDYPGRTILVGYFVENQDAGTAQKRNQYSQEIFDKFNDAIITACAAAQPPLDPSPRIRAAIAVMAQNAPGGNNGVKARRAVQAYLIFRGF